MSVEEVVPPNTNPHPYLTGKKYPRLILTSKHKNMTTANLIKSTASKNGGFVNTLLIEQIIQDDILGGEIIAKRAIFYKTKSAVELGEKPSFDLAKYTLSTITSVDETTGEIRKSDWIVGVA